MRAIGADDWADLREVRLRALADAPDAFGATLAAAESQPESFWRERAGSAGLTLLVWEDARPVAMGGIHAPTPGTGMVWGMWTAPEARGKGHGSRILDELLAWARRERLEVRLQVTEDNESARRLYIDRGFESTGEWAPLREGSPVRAEQLRLVG